MDADQIKNCQRPEEPMTKYSCKVFEIMMVWSGLRNETGWKIVQTLYHNIKNLANTLLKA